MNGRPVGRHVDHGPAMPGGGQELLSAGAEYRIVVIGVLTFAVRVLDHDLQGAPGLAAAHWSIGRSPSVLPAATIGRCPTCR